LSAPGGGCARQQNWPVFDLGIATKKNDDELIFAPQCVFIV